MRTLSVVDLCSHWVPGSRDQPWSWEDEERELHAAPCACCPDGEHSGPCDGCCSTPGHYQKALEAYIADRGITQGVCLGYDGRLWDGHHRVVAARRLGISHVPVEDD